MTNTSEKENISKESEDKYDTQKPLTSITIKIYSDNIHTQINKYKYKNLNITLGDFILYAICQNLNNYPEFNSLYEKSQQSNDNINVGYIINLGKGSTTAILNSANKKTLIEISKFVKEFALNYLRNDSKPLDKSDCFILVTNLSSFNSYIAIPPLYENTSSTITIGSEYDSIKYSDGIIKPKKEFTITLSYDSRIADCQKALEFLNSIKKNLEQDSQI